MPAPPLRGSVRQTTTAPSGPHLTQKEKEKPPLATQLGKNHQIQTQNPINTQIPYLNTYHFVGQHFLKYEAQNLQLVFASMP